MYKNKLGRWDSSFLTLADRPHYLAHIMTPFSARFFLWRAPATALLELLYLLHRTDRYDSRQVVYPPRRRRFWVLTTTRLHSCPCVRTGQINPGGRTVCGR